MEKIFIRPADPETDFGRLAEWFTILEDGEVNTENSLKEYYVKEKERITQRVGISPKGEPLGFFWAVRDRLYPDRIRFDLFVNPLERGKGIGGHLYAEMVGRVDWSGINRLRASTRDDLPAGAAFLKDRGFTERLHNICMMLDLDKFDDRPYDQQIQKFKNDGFLFTSMEELGNTEDAQRQLYLLNNTAGGDMPGSDGENIWESAKDFQQRVCKADWYMPAGQKVVIDTTTGTWAAMSAVTRFSGTDYAYNLFTGVDKHYRGRGLGQAVKVCALRFAREQLKTPTVRTHHNTRNAPILAIDEKFGYITLSGTLAMEKIIQP